MDPINPWLDPDEVRALADQLLRPVSQPAVSVPDAGFDAAFVGFASSPSPSQAPLPPFEAVASPPPSTVPTAPEPVPARQPAFEAVIEAEPQPVIADAPLVSEGEESADEAAHGPFLGRIRHFRDWIHHQFSATGIFILDREGAVIFDESNHGRLHFLARSLALASRRPGVTAGNVHVKIGAGATLEVIPVETAYGCLVLGAVVPEAMDPAAVAVVMKALSDTASPNTAN